MTDLENRVRAALVALNNGRELVMAGVRRAHEEGERQLAIAVRELEDVLTALKIAGLLDSEVAGDKDIG